MGDLAQRRSGMAWRGIPEPAHNSPTFIPRRGHQLLYTFFAALAPA